MPADTAQLPKYHLGEVIMMVLELKAAGASDGLVNKVVMDTSIPTGLQEAVKTISKKFPKGYNLDLIYPPQSSYLSD